MNSKSQELTDLACKFQQNNPSDDEANLLADILFLLSEKDISELSNIRKILKNPSVQNIPIVVTGGTVKIDNIDNFSF